MGVKFRSVLAGTALVLTVTAILPAGAAAQTTDARRLNLGAVSFLPPTRAVTTAPAVPTPPAPPSTYTWTGLYVGGLFGNAWGKADASTTTIFDPSGFFDVTSPPAINALSPFELRPTKSVFGGQAGFIGQAGSAVFGVEGDYQIMKLEEELSIDDVYPCCAPESFEVTQGVKTTWMFTVRGRVGAAFGPAMVYGTAGLAMTDLDFFAEFNGIDSFGETESSDVKETRKGLVWGAGAEFRGGQHWSVKGEFLHADFGTLTTTSTNLIAFGPSPENVFTHSTTLQVNILRFGVNFGF